MLVLNMHRSTESTRSTIHCTSRHWASPSILWIQTTKSNSKVYLQWNGRTFRPEGPVKLWTKMHCLNNAGRVDHPVWTTYIHHIHSSQLRMSHYHMMRVQLPDVILKMSVATASLSASPNPRRSKLCTWERRMIERQMVRLCHNTHHKCQKRHWLENTHYLMNHYVRN